MPEVVQWGDVPAWIAAAGAWAAILFQGVQGARRDWAESWPRIVEELSRLEAADIRRVLDDNPVVAEMVGVAWEAASQSAAEEKRRLLARVAAAALTGPDDAEIDKLPFLLRTVCALEPAHVRLIVLIGTPQPGKGQMANTRLEGCVTPEELVEAWPEVADLVYPMIALLSREGLINDRALGGYGGGNVWGLTQYGRRFLRFLPETANWRRRLDTAEVVLRIDGDNTLVARNLGPGDAQDVVLHPTNRSDGRSILATPTPPSGHPAAETAPGPISLAPEDEAQFPIYPSTLTDHPPYDIRVTWRDARGEQDRRQRLDVPG